MKNNFEQRIEAIEQRNKRVEIDKKWETSWLRRIILFVLTYIVILIFCLLTQLPDPFTNSLIPALAFVLSTMTLSFFKKQWLKKFHG